MKTVLAATVVCIAGGMAAYGQVGLGSISGAITDPSGSLVPGAKITVINNDTKLKSEV